LEAAISCGRKAVATAVRGVMMPAATSFVQRHSSLWARAQPDLHRVA